jgi:hypothetical protein
MRPLHEIENACSTSRPRESWGIDLTEVRVFFAFRI